MSKKVLIVDDEKSIRNVLVKLLSYEKFATLTASDGKSAIETVKNEVVDIVLLDIKMPGIDGIEVLEQVKRIDPSLPVVIVSGHGTVETAVEATKLGAFDFIEKPIDMERVLLTVRNGIKQGRLTRQNISLKKRVGGRTRIVGEDESVKEVLGIIERVAGTNARVLVTGENGTGKELVARKIHELSDRSSESFIEVNCAAIPEDLIESELFGHEKGAFTGATTRRIGKFELADEGTLFLDEVGDMSLSAQAKVLRVLQESVFERVGGAEQIDVDVRVIAASNKDLVEEAEKGRFRKDLFFRLNVVPVEVPPLRKRRDDIPLLSDFFLKQIGEELGIAAKKISPSAIEIMKRYSWPGNVRELRNLIERLCILTKDKEIDKSDLSFLAGGGSSDLRNDPFSIDDFQEFREFTEKEFLMRKLRKYDGNISQTARMLGMQRSNLYKKLEKYSIDYRG
ncbi:MAG TPA: sigma-54 dependent transcriptional regulator [Candidatus Krumholzibacteriaceae bacterium]|nr:sigma-54 dependent transcriptional regulator [Candidatus Krumholzibacteriaceae bacterium]